MGQDSKFLLPGFFAMSDYARSSGDSIDDESMDRIEAAIQPGAREPTPALRELMSAPMRGLEGELVPDRKRCPCGWRLPVFDVQVIDGWRGLLGNEQRVIVHVTCPDCGARMRMG